MAITNPEEKVQNPSRRKLLFGAIAAGIAAATAETTRQLGVWRGADIGIGDLADLERSLLSKREEFSNEYLKDPEAEVDIHKAAELFIQTELVRYLRENPEQSEVTLDTFKQQTFRPFMDGVQEKFSRRQLDNPPASEDNEDTQQFGTPSVALIANTKLALYDQIGDDPHYWAEKDNIVDVMTSENLQCRSGTRLLQLAMIETAQQSLQKGERIITIHSNQHIQLGLLTADNRVIAFEMTTGGKGIQDLGPMDQITTPVVITDANHDLAQSGLNTTAHKEQTVLFDNVPDTFTRLDSIFDKTTHFGGEGITAPGFSNGAIGGSNTATTDQYGFADGTVDVPSERQPIHTMDYIPSEFSTGNTESEGNIYDSLGGGREKFGDLYDLMSPSQKRTIMEFEVHSKVYSRHVSEISNSYYKLANGIEGTNVEAEVSNFMYHSEKLMEYVQKHDLDTKHNAYVEAINALIEENPQITGVNYPKNPSEFVRDALRQLRALAR